MTSAQYKFVGSKKVISKSNHVIGQGVSSKVFSGRFDDRDVALKRMDIDADMSGELDLLQLFEHDNIVRYLFKDVDDEYMYIVMEKCDCTLQQFIGNGSLQRKEDISPIEILRQTTNGLAYLHDIKNTIHRDLKPSNTLLLLRDGKWVVRIADFGISKQLPQNRSKITQTSIKGTVGNAAPEVLNKGKISKKSDIFSLGILYYFTLSGGEHPHGTDMLKLEAGIRDGEQPTMKHLVKKYADDAKSLILSMIAHKCEDRFDIRQVQSHYLFWKNEKKLIFIQAVSDYAISEKIEVMSTKLRNNSEQVVSNSWRALVYAQSPVIKNVLEKMLPKKTDDIMSLLRIIRNLKNHFHEKPTEFKNLITNCGSVDDMLEFFTDIFPALISHVYEVIGSDERENPNFKSFFYAKEESIPAMQSLTRQISSKHKFVETTIARIQPSDSKRVKVELELRNYQWELAEQALSGHNSLVVAPTGSGKTAVLTEIIRQHILKPEHSDRHVVFMAPKTALASQQFDFLKRHLSCTMDYIIGDNDDSAPAGRKILDNIITVLTPQILINELKRGKESYLGFKDISLLIFDECHHATKKHPYKEIMDMFLDAQNEKNSEQLSIQIVGVTASPGVGKAKCREKVKEKLLELLANLNIVSVPAVVEKNVVGLNQHQNEIKEYFIEVETEEIFGNEVKSVMNELEDCVKKINAQNGAENLNRIPSDKSKQSYEKWTDDLKQHGRKDLSDQEVGRQLITYAKHLRMYYNLLQLKDLVPNAMKHTNKQVKFKQVGFENIELDKKNKALQEKALTINVPMLDRLFEVVKQEFTNNKDARCIIFVKTRLTAMSLQECMKENEDLSELQPLYMTGRHASDASEATTKVGQENVLKSFRSGESKILIATSVAEEGLDIRECNLVIMYNHVTGEVGRVQRAGRGRAAGSRAIVITSVSSDHVSREVENKICADASKIAIEDLKHIPQEDLKNHILMIQKQQIAKRKRRENEEALEAENKDPSSKWEILCVDCGNFITTGDKLRHIENTHSVIKDESFYSTVQREEIDLQKNPKKSGTANFLCNNPKCGNKIALEMIFGKKRYPTLSMKRIKLRKDDGEIMVPKQKKNLPFSVNMSIDDPDDEVVVEPTETDTEPASDNSLDSSQILELLGLMEIED